MKARVRVRGDKHVNRKVFPLSLPLEHCRRFGSPFHSNTAGASVISGGVCESACVCVRELWTDYGEGCDGGGNRGVGRRGNYPGHDDIGAPL